MRRYDVKKNIALLFIAVAVLAFAGCDGSLHNTPISYVTFSFVNFPAPDGTYDLRGAFAEHAWDGNWNGRNFEIAGGSGSYTTPIAILSGTLQFQPTTAVVGQWNRPWYPTTKGVDNGYGEYTNFEAIVPMDGLTHNITIDGSTTIATVTVE